MERKDFLKLTGSFCILASTGFVAGTLSACNQLPIYKTAINDNKITVPLLLFAQTSLQIVRSKQLDYDIALRKEQDGAYTAILLRCTHADNELVSTGKGFICNLHGSRFNADGNVTKGPASKSLKKYLTEITENNILIHIK